MTERLFGTDGIRGVAGVGPLAPSAVLRVGRALGRVLGGPGARCAVCRDTRRSGPMVARALEAGLLAEGVDVLDAGVRPTPALPYLAEAWSCGFGVVISASHNPMEYNGIKVFGGGGAKISDETERALEEEMTRETEPRRGQDVGNLMSAPRGPDPYREALVFAAKKLADAPPRKIVLDCANGAAFLDGPAVFRRLGFRVIPLHCEPDGANINRACGALHPETMCRAVIDGRAEAGFALDGDADRVLLADENGQLKDGDFVLAALARRMKASGTLPGDTVVGTIMSNLGLEIALRREGISLHRTAVGDRNVVAAMETNRWALGGEPSGHIVFRGGGGCLPGDGLLTALKVLEHAVETGTPLSALAGEWKRLPQTILNVPVAEKTPFETVEGLPERIEKAEKELGETGRVVLRYSGTEPVARVMVEGPDETTVERLAGEIAERLARAQEAKRT